MKFIMDIGCGHDLIPKSRVKKLNLNNVNDDSDPISFYTANGVTSTTGTAEIEFKEFRWKCRPFVLDETPSVLSVGKKCMEEGFSFIWPVKESNFSSPPSYLLLWLHIHESWLTRNLSLGNLHGRTFTLIISFIHAHLLFMSPHHRYVCWEQRDRDLVDQLE